MALWRRLNPVVLAILRALTVSARRDLNTSILTVESLEIQQRAGAPRGPAGSRRLRAGLRLQSLLTVPLVQEALSAATLALEISSHNARFQALQKRWDYLRAGLDLILDQRGADMADVPGGATGLLCRDYEGKEADKLVTRIDSDAVSLVAELRGHERQAAGEPGQGKTRVEERKPLDTSPLAITLALLLTDEELDSLAKRGWRWRNRGARTTRWIKCRKPSTGCSPW